MSEFQFYQKPVKAKKSRFVGWFVSLERVNASVGGSNTVIISGSTDDHTLTVNEMPSHNHYGWGEAFPSMAPFGVSGGSGHLGASNSDRDNYYYNTSGTGGGQGHNHGLASASADNRPEYATFVVCVKD